MDDHFDIGRIFEKGKFDITRLTCILNVHLVFTSFVKNLLIFLVFHKFGTFLDECFEILFHNKIFRVLN